jgi:hypothetical protein
MLALIPDLPDHVLGLKATGTVSSGDYEAVLVPELERMLAAHARVRLLYVLAEGFDNYTRGAAWEDAKVGMRHFTSFERVAVVTDVDWIETGVKAFGFVMPGDVRVYDGHELDQAREWVCEPLSSGALEFELLEDEGILILAPRGPLEAGDFDRLTAVLDPWLESGRRLNGLVIDAEHFPGWDDLRGLVSHVRFVKDHQSRVRRVAFVSDDRLLHAVPSIAGRFLSAEVRAFEEAKLDDALAWVREGSES